MSDRPLRLLILSDGKPGHYKKSEAVARSIAAERSAEIVWCEVRLRLAVFHDALRLHLRQHRNLPGLRWLSLLHQLPQPLPDRPDLIVSSGGKTVYANAWLAQHYGCPNVFVGDTRGVHAAYFTRLLVHEDVHGDDPRFIPTLIPTEINAALLARAAAEYRAARDAGFARRRHWTLLVGGDSGGYRFSAEDWEALAAAIPALAQRHGIRWLATTSRRTSREAERVLARQDVATWLDEMQVYRTDKRRIYNALLGCGEAIFCTEDSGTMLTEAAATGKPVFSLSPRCAQPTPALRNLLELYEDRGSLKRRSLANLRALQARDLEGFSTAGQSDLAAVTGRILTALAPAA